MRFLLAVTLSFLFVSPAFSRDLLVKEKVSDFEQLNSFVEAHYGPFQYKQTVRGMDYWKLRADYRTRIESSKTNAEFYYLILKYVAEFHDGHFSARLPSKLKSEIPLGTELIQGKVLLSTIDRTALPETAFPFQKGDEVVSLNGKPVADVIDEIRQYKGSGYIESERGGAARRIFLRNGMSLPVQHGDVKVEIRRQNSGALETATLTWKVSGNALDEDDKSSLSSVIAEPHPLKVLSTLEDWKEDLGEKRMEDSYQCSGSTRIAIPEGATTIMTVPFVAYYYPTEKGNVGYLRIPHYSWRKEDEVTPNYNEVFKQYEYAISLLEKNTIGLVIDQDHNCGGSVEFFERMLGLFMDKPYPGTMFQLLATKTQYLQALQWAEEDTAPNTLERENALSLANVVKAAWLRGDFMTEKTTIGNGATLLPNPVRYSKPIVMLVDIYSGSGGDAFPSLMQGFGRAKLLGTRTSGLGGHVEKMPNLNYSGISLRLTRSLFFRPDGVPVENNGAVPDVPYEITKEDFLGGYKDYQKFYTSELLKIVP